MMKPKEMDRLMDAHLQAETAADSAGSVSMYTKDLEHGVVGAPHGPLRGKEAARGFYERVISDIRTEEMVPTRRYYGEDFCVVEHTWKGAVPGSFLGVLGNGKRISSGCCTYGSSATGSSAARTYGSTAGTSLGRATGGDEEEIGERVG